MHRNLASSAETKHGQPWVNLRSACTALPMRSGGGMSRHGEITMLQGH